MNDYQKVKAQGLVKLQRINAKLAIVVRAKFNASTGERLDDDVVQVNLDDLNKQLANLKSEHDILASLIADIELQPAVVPVP